MKLISYLDPQDEQDHLALVHDNIAYNLSELDWRLPGNMQLFLYAWDDVIDVALEYDRLIKSGSITHRKPRPLETLQLLAPVPQPTSCRDGYAFRQHVEAARRNRGVPMIEAFDQFPVFYFTNHNAIIGPGPVSCMPDHFHQLDFELEVAVVICRKGRNLRAEEADQYIGGFMIMNDFSARLLQMEEMQLSLGPAKGKDFATAIGPMLVTPDELEPYRVAPKPGHVGNSYDLRMTCRVNGTQVSEGNLRDMDWTFAEIIERCAYGTDLFPGDIIGSGTVGTGCFLELNGTALRHDPAYTPQWLQEGDVVELEITGLGTLTNTIVRCASDFSILKRKK